MQQQGWLGWCTIRSCLVAASTTGTASPQPTPARLMLRFFCWPMSFQPVTHLIHLPSSGAAHWSMPSPLTLRLGPLLHGEVAPWPTPFLRASQCILSPHGINAHWHETYPPTLQRAPPPHLHGNVAPPPMPSTPMPQPLVGYNGFHGQEAHLDNDG